MKSFFFNSIFIQLPAYIYKYFKVSKKKIEKFSGAYSFGETPVPISNTVVKSKASMILGWRRPGKVDSAGIKNNKKAPYNYGAFLYLKL